MKGEDVVGMVGVFVAKVGPGVITTGAFVGSLVGLCVGPEPKA